MVGRAMHVALDHRRRAPAAKSLQLVRRRSRLAMPRLRVPHIVPAEIRKLSMPARSKASWPSPNRDFDHSAADAALASRSADITAECALRLQELCAGA